jgi:hypothetical protein
MPIYNYIYIHTSYQNVDTHGIIETYDSEWDFQEFWHENSDGLWWFYISSDSEFIIHEEHGRTKVPSGKLT